MNDLFRREIELQKLPKKAQAVLKKCDRLVEHYRRTGVRTIHISQDDYRLLNNAMNNSEQSLQDRNYKGFELVSV